MPPIPIGTLYIQYSVLRTQKLFIRPYTHLQNKVQCMNNNVYIMYIWVKETPTKTFLVNVASAGAPPVWPTFHVMWQTFLQNYMFLIFYAISGKFNPNLICPTLHQHRLYWAKGHMGGDIRYNLVWLSNSIHWYENAFYKCNIVLNTYWS